MSLEGKCGIVICCLCHAFHQKKNKNKMALLGGQSFLAQVTGSKLFFSLSVEILFVQFLKYCSCDAICTLCVLCITKSYIQCEHNKHFKKCPQNAPMLGNYLFNEDMQQALGHWVLTTEQNSEQCHVCFCYFFQTDT